MPADNSQLMLRMLSSILEEWSSVECFMLAPFQLSFLFRKKVFTAIKPGMSEKNFLHVCSCVHNASGGKEQQVQIYHMIVCLNFL